MLCALGAVVFAAAAAKGSVRQSAALAGGFGFAALFTSGSSLPDASWTGGLAAAGAAAWLFKPGLRLASAAIGGVLAGSWTALLEVQALPMAAALLIAAALVIVTMRLSRVRASFAPDVLRDEGMLAIGVLGLGVAVMPGVLDGWQAATNLSGAQDRVAEPIAIPMWTLALILTASSLGGLYSVWSRR
jgi:hypothetical protein